MYGGCEADPGRPTAKGIFLGFMEAAEMGAEETAFVGAGGIKLCRVGAGNGMALPGLGVTWPEASYGRATK
jgi:hypothetical protein